MKYFIVYDWYDASGMYEDSEKYEIPVSLYVALATMQPRELATKSVHRVLNGLISHPKWSDNDRWDIVIEY